MPTLQFCTGFTSYVLRKTSSSPVRCRLGAAALVLPPRGRARLPPVLPPHQLAPAGDARGGRRHDARRRRRPDAVRQARGDGARRRRLHGPDLRQQRAQGKSALAALQELTLSAKRQTKIPRRDITEMLHRWRD